MDVYRAIADPTRRALLDELVERGGQSLFELCARLTMKHGIGSSRQAISQHLDALQTAGLVRTRRQGRAKLHWFVGAPLEAIAARWPTTPRETTETPDPCASTSPASSSTTSARRSASTPRRSASRRSTTSRSDSTPG